MRHMGWMGAALIGLSVGLGLWITWLAGGDSDAAVALESAEERSRKSAASEAEGGSLEGSAGAAAGVVVTGLSAGTKTADGEVQPLVAAAHREDEEEAERADGVHAAIWRGPRERIRGRVLNLDGQPVATGRITLGIPGRSGLEASAPITGGRFEMELPRSPRFEVQAVAFGERTAIPRERSLRRRAGEEVLVRAWLPEAVQIVASAAESGQPLREVQIFDASTDPDDPGPSEGSILAQGPSPLAIWPERTREAVWIGAPGRARVRKVLDARGADPIEVRLPLATELRVRCEGGELPPEARLRVYSGSPSGRSLVREASVESKKLFRALTPGTKTIRIEMGGSPGRAPLVAETTLLLRAEGQHQVTLTYDAKRWKRDRVRVTVTLELPPEHAERRPGLELRPARRDPRMQVRRLGAIDLKPVAKKGPGAQLQFTIEDMLPGPWVAAVLGQVLPFEVPEGVEEHGVTLRIPRPAEVILSVVEAGSGMLVDKGLVALRSHARRSPAVATRAAGRRLQDGTYRLLLAPGPALLEVRAPGYAPLARKVTIEPGRNMMEVELASRQGLRLSATLDGRPYPLGAAYRMRISDRSGRAMPGDQTQNGTTISRFLPNPGRYLVELSTPSDVLAPPARWVEVGNGVMSEVELPLRRR